MTRAAAPSLIDEALAAVMPPSRRRRAQRRDLGGVGLARLLVLLDQDLVPLRVTTSTGTISA
jgi:hypothetical protein